MKGGNDCDGGGGGAGASAMDVSHGGHGGAASVAASKKEAIEVNEVGTASSEKEEENDNNGDEEQPQIIQGKEEKDNKRSSDSSAINNSAGKKTSKGTSRSRSLGSRRTSVYADIVISSYVPGYKLRLFSPPRQRQKWGDDQCLPRVNWGDLFFDLFYVGAFYNLGNILVTMPSSIGILYFLSCFFPIMQLWSDKTFYDSRFVYGDDIWHKLFETAVLVVLATAISYIASVDKMSNPKEYVDMFGFSLSLTVAGCLQILRSFEIWIFGRGQRKVIEAVAKRDIVWIIPRVGFYLAASIVSGLAYFGNKEDGDDSHRLLAGGGGGDGECDYSQMNHIPIVLVLIGFISTQLHMIIVITCCFPKNGEHKKTTVPINIDFTIHRHGEWTMLVLGESVLSLLIVDATTRDYISAFYCGTITVIMLQYLHFRSQPHDADAHAMRRTVNSGVLYGQMFFWYSAALVAVGASYKLFLYDFSDDDHRLLQVQRFSFLPTHDNMITENNNADDVRLLAGASSGGCGPTGDEKEQNVAHIFCGALAIVFFCMDVIVLAHVGLEKEVGKCQLVDGVCTVTGEASKKHLNYKGIALVCFRVAITIFTATLSQYVTDPRRLAEIGLVVVICQLITRFLGDVFFPEDLNYGGHHHQEGMDDEQEDDEYNEEYKWPNVTHAQAVERK